MRNFKILKIKDIEWKFIFFTDRGYERKFGKDDSYAITFFKEREVYFNIKYASPSIIRHELIHVLLASTCTDSATLSGAKVEEVLAEIMEEHFVDFIFYMMELIFFVDAYSIYKFGSSTYPKSYINKLILLIKDRKRKLELHPPKERQ